jgi:hypothetical protein
VSRSTASDYLVFGFKVRSDIPLPELLAEDSGGAPDVIIRSGPVIAPGDARTGLHAHDGALILLIPDVGRYEVRDGSSIIVEAAPGAPDKNIRLFLLGSAFGALLHQRGLLPLHANAVEIDGRAVAFMGASGQGKSTLAAWFHDRGHRIIADDVCVVRFDAAGQAWALPGLPRLRLWQEALERMGRRAEDYERSYVGDELYGKFDVPLPEQTLAGKEIRLGALYKLAQGEEFEINLLAGADAAEAVFANTYRGHFLPLAKQQEHHWRSCVQLVKSTPVYQLSREWGLSKTEDQNRRLLRHAKGLESCA